LLNLDIHIQVHMFICLTVRTVSCICVPCGQLVSMVVTIGEWPHFSRDCVVFLFTA